MKKLLLVFLVLLFLVGCATQKYTYLRAPFTPPSKSEEYKLPQVDFGDPPKAMYFAKQADGSWREVPKEQGEVTAYTSKELGKITIRLEYSKEIIPKLVELVNTHISRENVLVDLVIDQQTGKELIRELLVDIQNKADSDKMWGNVEKGGYWAIIIGQLILLLSL